jgi:hypothetical protein
MYVIARQISLWLFGLVVKLSFATQSGGLEFESRGWRLFFAVRHDHCSVQTWLNTS